jgi:hypothetical protein
MKNQMVMRQKAARSKAFVGCGECSAEPLEHASPRRG